MPAFARSRTPFEVLPVNPSEIPFTPAITLFEIGDGTLEGMSDGGSDSSTSDVGDIVFVGSPVPSVTGTVGELEGLNSVEGAAVLVGVAVFGGTVGSFSSPTRIKPSGYL